MYELVYRLYVRDCKVDIVCLLCFYEINVILKKGM